MGRNINISLPKAQFFYKDLIIKRIYYPDYMNQIGKLRVEVWKEIEGMNPDLMASGSWIDASDKDAIHWVVLQNDNLVGAARMTIHESFADIPYGKMIEKFSLKNLEFPVSSINRLVIKPDCCNKGLARRIDEERIKTSRDIGVNCIIAEPVSWRIDPLKKLGYEVVGELGNPFEAPGLMLTLMIKNLNKSAEKTKSNR